MAAPVIHYTFDTDGTNSGSLGSANDAYIPIQSQISSSSDLSTIDTVNKIEGTASVATGEYVYLGDSLPRFIFNTGTGWSFSFWARHNSNTTTTLRALFSMYDYGSNTDLSPPNIPGYHYRRELASVNNNSMRFYPGGGGSYNVGSVDDIDNTDGLWHHYVVVPVNNDNSMMVVYYDGSLLGTPFNVVMTDNTNMLVFVGGRFYGSGSNRGVDGNLDNFRVYDYDVDTTMIDMLYKLGSDTNVASLSGATMSSLQNAGATLPQLVTAGISVAELVAGGVTVAELLAAGVSQADIDIANIQIKIHSDFTISDGTSSSVFATTDAVTVYTPATFADKLTADLTGNTVTVGSDVTLTDSTPFYRIYLEFANAATLTGMPAYIFTVPFSDFSVGAGGQVNLRNVNLDAQMTITAGSSGTVLFGQLGTDIDGIDASERSGDSVSLSSDGSIVAVGAYMHDSNKGTTRIYQYNGTTWSQIGSDIDGEAAGDQSGSSVSLSSDGSIVAIGAYAHDDYKGTTRIYQYNGTNWSKIGSDIDGSDTDDYSGNSVSLSSDGSIVAIGAKKHDNNKGTTRIYQNAFGINSAWIQIGSDIDGLTGDFFGMSVAISADGSIVAIGATDHDGGKGTTRIYQNINSTWTQIGSDIDGLDASEYSGRVSLSSDGSIVAIGATAHDSHKGTTRIYQNINSTWSKLGLDIDGEFTGDESGYSISLSSDGSIVAVSTKDHDGDKGTTRIYKYSTPGQTGGSWIQSGLDIDGVDASESSGWSVSLSGDGSIVAIGAPHNASFKGTTRIYQLPSTISTSSTSTIPANNYFINNFVSTIETDLVDFTLLYDASNALITFDGLATDISMSITSTDTTIFDTSITEITTAANTLPFITYGQPDPTFANYITNGMTITELLTAYTAAELVAGGVSQAEIDLIITQIKIHSDFTISDGTSSSVFATTDAVTVYTPATFADKLTADLTGNTVTVGSDVTLTGDGTDFYRIYLEFANAATLTGMPAYIFTVPFSDFSVGAGGQVNLRNVNLDAQMTMAANFSTTLTFGQLGLNIDGDGDTAGKSVSLSSDGNIVAIGAIGYDQGKGATRIYKYSTPGLTGGSWSQLGSNIVGEQAIEYSGQSVSLNSDGSIVAIGAYTHDTYSSPKGTTRIYKYSTPGLLNGTWSQLGLDIDGELSGDRSGISVSLISDGSIVAIGADGHESDKGTTRIYKYSTPGLTGGSWSKLGSDIDGVLAGELSGHSVSLNKDDGSIVAIGAYEHNGRKGTTRIYLYSTPGLTGGSWSQLGSNIDGLNYNENSGYSVSLRNDGNIVAIGAYRYSNMRGTTRIYEYSTPGVIGGSWSILGEDIDGLDASERSGISVSLNSDGSIVAIGAVQHNGGKGTTRIYQYKIPTTTEWDTASVVIKGTDTTQVVDKLYWTHLEVNNGMDGVYVNEGFGESVSLSSDGSTVANGAFQYQSPNGTTYIYQLSSTISSSTTSIIPANNYFINNFVSTIETDLVDYTLLYDASNALITFDGLTQDISMSITSTDTTVFDTSITEITVAENTLPFITYGQPDPTFANYITNGMTITELLTVYTVAELVVGNVSVAQLVAANITIPQLLAAGVTAAELVAAGVTQADIDIALTQIKIHSDFTISDGTNSSVFIAESISPNNPLNSPNVFESTDAKTTTTSSTTMLGQNWTDIEMSSTGQYLIAVVGGKNCNGAYSYSNKTGNVWISVDYGENWTEKTVAGGAKQWAFAMISGDGSVMMVKANGDVLWRSTDYGVNWSQVSFTFTDITPSTTVGRTGLPMKMAYDGNHICSLTYINNLGNGQYNYSVVVSDDGGGTWTTVTTTNGRIASFNASKNGQYIIITYTDGTTKPKYSADYGATFISLINGSIITEGNNFYHAYQRNGSCISNTGKVCYENWAQPANFHNIDVTTGTITNGENDAAETTVTGPQANSGGECYGMNSSNDGKYILFYGYMQWNYADSPPIVTSGYLSTDYGASFVFHNSSGNLYVDGIANFTVTPANNRIYGMRFSDDNKYIAIVRETDAIYVRTNTFVPSVVYTPTTFADKLTADLTGNTVTAGGDLTTTDSTPYYRLYLQFANAATLTGIPKDIFNIPFSDFSVGAGGQVNLRNVNLDASMNIVASYSTPIPFGFDTVFVTDTNAPLSTAFNGTADSYGMLGPTFSNIVNDGTKFFDRYKTTTLNVDGSTIAMSYGASGVKVFDRDPTEVDGWKQIGDTFPALNSSAQFGYYMNLSNDGQIIAITDDRNGTINTAGYTTVYRRNAAEATGWELMGGAMELQGIAGDYQTAPSLSGDGTIIAVGTNSPSPGKVRVFNYDDGTNTWIQQGATFTPADGISQPPSLSSNGTVLAIPNATGTTGAAIYERTTTASTTWTQIGSNIGVGRYQLILNKNGDIFVYTDNTTIYVYKRDTNDASGWSLMGDAITMYSGGEERNNSTRIDFDDVGHTVTCSHWAYGGDVKGIIMIYKYNTTSLAWEHAVTDNAITGHSSSTYANNYSAGGTDPIVGVHHNSLFNRHGHTLSGDGSNLIITSDGHNGTGSECYIYTIPHKKVTSNTSTIPAGNNFINNFVSTIETDLVNYPLSYDASNALITLDGLAQDISMSITSTDTTVFDTTITEITQGVNTLPFITYGQPDPTFANYIANGMTVTEFISNGYTLNELLTGGVTAAQLVAGGVTAAQLLAADVTVAELVAAGVTIQQLFAAGVTIQQLFAAGVIPDWTFDTDANHFDQSYVKGFVDLSGSIVIRNDNKLITNGDLSLGGNLTVYSPGTTSFSNESMTLKSRLFMGEDISANGNVYVGGDLSVNGQFSGNFANGIIPESAISRVIEISGNVVFTDDVSFNGPTVDVSNTLPVNQIEFNDATTMTTYDDNILSGTFAGADVIFKDSTFTSVICEGVATATTVTQSSDHRIKENVTELNETDTVDALVPIQYNNTVSGNHEFGLLAHELQEVYPDLVVGEKDGAEYQQVHYNGLIGVLVKEIQGLKQRLAVLNK